MKPLNFNSLKKGAIICALFCASPSIAQSVEPIMGAEIKAGKLNVAAEDLGMPRWITFGITVTPPQAAATPREVQIISK